jgi:hypothetical protein
MQTTRIVQTNRRDGAKSAMFVASSQINEGTFMSEHEENGSAAADNTRPKGEYKMLLLVFALCVALFADSLRSDGVFQGVSAGPGSIPQLVGAATLLIIVGLTSMNQPVEY